MAITRYQNPVNMLQRLNQEMNDMTSRFFGRPTSWSADADWPRAEALFTPVDVQESDGEVVVKMDVPGAKTEDFKVDCSGDRLTISGERKQEKTETKGRIQYSERQYGSFMRTVQLPAEVTQDKIRARYQDGVLEVHLPKAAKGKTRNIKVERA